MADAIAAEHGEIAEAVAAAMADARSRQPLGLPIQLAIAQALLARAERHDTTTAQHLLDRARQQLLHYQRASSVEPDSEAGPATQETATLQSVLAQLNAQTGAAEEPGSLGVRKNATIGAHSSAELKSVERLRQVVTQQSTRNQVRAAMDSSPEDPGPLNPARLAISSLALLDELSPDYLNNLVTYLNTLSFLGSTAGKR